MSATELSFHHAGKLGTVTGVHDSGSQWVRSIVVALDGASGAHVLRGSAVARGRWHVGDRVRVVNAAYGNGAALEEAED